MRHLLLIALLVANVPESHAQTPAQPAPAPRPAQPAPQTAKPAQPTTPTSKPAQPAPQRRAQPSTRSGVAITVTDPRGMTLRAVHVQLLGATDRSGDTDASGQVNFPGLQAGTYRLRFSGDQIITFEREVTLRAGQIADVDVTLNAAPPPPAPAPTPAPAPEPQVGPAGEPLLLSVPDLLEQNFIGSQPRRETLLSCSGNTRTTMIQLNEPLPNRLYETADAVYYVIGGEGAARIAGRETKLTTNGYVSVPRDTGHSFVRAGRRPLILLAVLSGEPCEEAK